MTSKPQRDDQGSSPDPKQPTAQGHEADNPYSYAKIVGSTGIRVNIFAGDNELDKALRLLRAATKRVDEAVSDLITEGSSQDTVTPSRPGEHKKQELERGK